MGKWVLIFLVFLCLLHGRLSAQYISPYPDTSQHHLLGLFLSTDPAVDETYFQLARQTWAKFLSEQVKVHRSLNAEVILVNHLIQHIRDRCLLHYNIESNFGDLFLPKPRFNCLTSTALIALGLEEFDIDYAIRETNNHVYLIIPEHHLLIETTDENGIVKGRKAIKKMQRNYARQNRNPKYGASLPLFIDKTITIDQLVGLLYYNRAIDHIRAEEWSQAMPLLNSTEEFYFSMRITYFKMRVNARLPENSYIYMKHRR